MLQLIDVYDHYLGQRLPLLEAGAWDDDTKATVD